MFSSAVYASHEMVIHFDHVWQLNLDLVFQFLGITIDKDRGSIPAPDVAAVTTLIIPSANNIAFSINSMIKCPFFFL
jgi:hypothetical protein